jgi:phage major head subunit gpT-like protein
MAVVTSDFLAGMVTNFQAIFTKALGDNASKLDDVMKIASRVPSDTDKNAYGWFGITPPMAEWKDKRKLQGLLPYSYELKNKHWESSLDVNRDTFEDDKYNMLAPRIRGLSSAWFRAVHREVFSLLDGAHTLLAYDAAAMCIDTRTIGGSANIDNYLSGNYSDSEAEIRTALAEGAVAMAGYQDDWGEPLNLQPDTIVCSPSQAIKIQQALIPGVAGTTRPELQFVKNIVVSPWIDGAAADWFLLCTTEEIKPLIWQVRKEPEFNSVVNPNDKQVFNDNFFNFGIDARFTVGFGDPRTVIQFHNT